jgi:phosphonate transport system ATP-binding protein
MIEFKDVSKVYPNGVVGLDNVNLKIEQGEFVAIIGLSGAGKSTLLRTINRMHDITSGTLTVDGLEVKRKRASYFPQKDRNDLPVIQSCHTNNSNP